MDWITDEMVLAATAGGMALAFILVGLVVVRVFRRPRSGRLPAPTVDRDAEWRANKVGGGAVTPKPLLKRTSGGTWRQGRSEGQGNSRVGGGVVRQVKRHPRRRDGRR